MVSVGVPTCAIFPCLCSVSVFAEKFPKRETLLHAGDGGIKLGEGHDLTRNYKSIYYVQYICCKHNPHTLLIIYASPSTNL